MLNQQAWETAELHDQICRISNSFAFAFHSSSFQPFASHYLTRKAFNAEMTSFQKEAVLVIKSLCHKTREGYNPVNINVQNWGPKNCAVCIIITLLLIIHAITVLTGHCTVCTTSLETETYSRMQHSFKFDSIITRSLAQVKPF